MRINQRMCFDASPLLGITISSFARVEEVDGAPS